MIRISFRQGMLAGVALIVLLLGGVALRSWMLVETLVEQNRRNSEQAILLTAAIQELAERSVDIERSARQYLVLEDPLFRQRFDEHLSQSLVLVDRLDSLTAEPLTPFLGGWRMVAAALRGGLDKRIGRDELAPFLARLMELNDLLKQAGQRWIESRNTHLLGELEAHRLRLGGQILLALGGALLVALAMGWWLVRPVRQLERAIGRLGASRFDEAVQVGGPDDLRQLGRRLDWLRQRLADLEADREQALRHVSHELKTPLTALKEGIALLREEVPGPLGENQREVVDILQHNVHGLQRQIESLLSLNGTAFEARKLHLESGDPHKVLAGVVKRRELHAQSRQVSVVVEAPASGPALIDADKLAVALDNLLSNAIDFSPEGGEVRLVLARSEGVLRFECIDQGPGVAPEDRQRIFDPFVQGKREAPLPRQGSGVGLSIVRELVGAMGGVVAVMPVERGGHFIVEIPDEN
ncbi:MAG: HAMP domain-containing protein [Azonexus sp.]|jgi:two-component system sensor histidine kinase GlrK|uniref:HAMP domain-containing sensor histidine kinase n=1 Tax=Azonexus sp. TaxID=1872668 RepID=UPI002832B47C|nr:ATP-binding protein [Azonexus sp.]MDR0775043.1 HAMP domain-containing protein [Azonexus sp.]